MIKLGDGSMGMLPEEWLKKYGMLADLGTAENGDLRFSSSQAGMLDALLAAQPEIQVDAAFEKVRRAPPPVRGGRRAGLAAGLPRRAAPLPARGAGLARLPPAVRLRRLPGRRHGPGQDGPGAGPAPAASVRAGRPRARRWPWCPARWCSTGSRRPKFTPRLRVLDYTGPSRHALREQFADYDLIITTYGTLRTDIAELTNIRVRLRHPRRGPGDQERRQPVGQGRAGCCAAGTAWP